MPKKETNIFQNLISTRHFTDGISKWKLHNVLLLQVSLDFPTIV